MEEREEVGDGRTEGLSSIGDGGQAAISLTPEADEKHVCIFESLHLEGLYVGDLLYISIKLENLKHVKL